MVGGLLQHHQAWVIESLMRLLMVMCLLLITLITLTTVTELQISKYRPMAIIFRTAILHLGLATLVVVVLVPAMVAGIEEIMIGGSSSFTLIIRHRGESLIHVISS